MGDRHTNASERPDAAPTGAGPQPPDAPVEVTPQGALPDEHSFTHDAPPMEVDSYGGAERRQEPKRPLRTKGRRRHAMMRLCGGVFALLATLLVVVVGGIALKLRAGPIDVSRLTPMLGELLSAQLPNGSARIDGAQLSLLPDRPGALNVALSGFTLRDAGGSPLAQAPNVSGVFLISDLIRGKVEPSELVVSDVVVAVRRLEDGRLVIDASSNGEGGGDIDGAALVALLSAARENGAEDAEADAAESEAPSTTTEPATEASPDPTGNGPGAPEVLSFENEGALLSLQNVDLIYTDDITGREWHASDVVVTFANSPLGVRAVADIDVDGGRFGRQTLRVQGYRTGAGALYLNGEFSNIAVADIASQITALEWLAPFEAPVAGRLELALDGDGQVTAMEGSLRAGSGLFRIPGAQGRGSVTSILTAGLDFEYQPLSERFIVSRLNMDAARGRFEGEGLIELERRDDETLTGLVAQVTLRDIIAVAPEVFAAPMSYDRADMTARLNLDPFTVEVGEITLNRGDLTLSGAGVIRNLGEAVSADLILRGGGMTAADLLAHWPSQAVGNARKWVEENVIKGRIDDVNASIRVGGTDDVVSLDFTFSDIDSRYLGDMPPVRGGAGAGQLNLSAFHLNLTAGEVAVPGTVANAVQDDQPDVVPLIGGAPLDLTGSSLSITGLDQPLEQMNVDLVVSGPAEAMLTIIDSPPLNLVSKLGAPLSVSAGQGEARATVQFPLLKDLLVEDVAVDSTVTLTDIRGVAGPDALSVIASQIDINASAERMTLTLDGKVEGVAIDATWRENFSNGARSVSARGAVTPAILSRFGVEQPWFSDGSIGATVTAEAIAGGYQIDIDANATNARFDVPSFGWRKPVGEASGVRSTVRIAGGEVALGNLRATAGDYAVAGDVRLADDGTPIELRFDHLKAPGLIDSALTVEKVGQGWAASMTGAYLNVAALRDRIGNLGDDEGEASGNKIPTTDDVLPTDTPVNASLNITRVQLTDDIHIADAKGALALGSQTRGRLTGNIGGVAPVLLEVEPSGADRAIRVTSDDAGNLMRALGVFDDGSGGSLEINATLPAGDNRAADGLLQVYGLVIHDDAKLEGMLIGGELDELREKMRADGINFKKVIAPFAWRNDVLSVANGTARGTDIGLTIDGKFFIDEERLDMEGVFTPFYGVNSALSKVPVLGTVLTGGRGQGIFALNYTVTGPASDPQVSVNPLSILAPGILRRLLDGDGEAPAESTNPDR